MEVLVYGFARGPGELPEVMNVARGSLHLKLRALSEAPSFDGFDAVVMPFDTYHPWDGEAGGAGPLTEIHVRAGVAVRQAAAAGCAVAFIYQDCFAHYRQWEELAARSLGGMVLADLGITACALPGPEDGLQVLAPAFASYLQRFGISESYLEVNGTTRELQPLCRTQDRLLTGVAAREGRGTLLLLPGDPRRRALEFFTALGEALATFCAGGAGATSYLFTEERALLREREDARRQLRQVEDRLARFRRCRDLLAAVPANPDRRLPEWFATFLGMELAPGDEEQVFEFPGGRGGVAGRLALGGEQPDDALLALSACRRRVPALLYLPHGLPAGEAGDRLGEAAREAGVSLLAPADLLALVEEWEGAAGEDPPTARALVRFALRRAVNPPGP